MLKSTKDHAIIVSILYIFVKIFLSKQEAIYWAESEIRQVVSWHFL